MFLSSVARNTFRQQMFLPENCQFRGPQAALLRQIVGLGWNKILENRVEALRVGRVLIEITLFPQKRVCQGA
mgnify:CR=1 FL=1